MKTPKEWIPSDEELKLITFVINHCITIGDLWLRFMIFAKQNTNETTGDRIEKWQEEINRKEKRKVFLSKNQELFLRYPNIYNTIEKHKLNETIFLKEFIKFFYEYLDKIPILKNFLVNLQKMETKSGGEIASITVREFLAPIVTKFPAKRTLSFSHFKLVENLILFLEAMGEEGTALAEKIKKYTKAEKQEIFSSPHPWLNTLLICFKQAVFDKALKTPAITSENSKGLKKLLQAQKPRISVSDTSIDYFREGDNQRLGFLPTKTENFPNVHPSRIPLIKSGGEIFGSFMSHKLLHYESKIFYERWKDPSIRLKENYSCISIEGGYKELVQRLGNYPDGENIKKLQQLLHFQAHFLFTLPEEGGGCRIGNLIALEEKKNHFGKTEEIRITAGTMLTPDAVYKSNTQKGGRLLIPFVDLPDKMVGYPATWGSQAFLQMLILEYLTNQSREFAEKASVHISKEKWEALATEANLPTKFLGRLEEIQKLFCCSEQGFLDKQGEEYSFNKKNEKAKVHLIAQGKLREKRSNQAKRKGKSQKNR